MDVWVTAGCRVNVAVSRAGTVAVGKAWVAVSGNAVAVAMGVIIIIGVIVEVDSGASVGCSVWLL